LDEALQKINSPIWERIKRLATKNTIITVPVVVVEPIPVLNPLVVVPVNVIGVLGIVGMTPQKICNTPSISLPIEFSIELYFIWRLYLASILHQVF
jgi:hypothetical protein